VRDLERGQKGGFWCGVGVTAVSMLWLQAGRSQEPVWGPATVLPKLPYLRQPAPPSRRGGFNSLAGTSTLPGLGTDRAISIVASDGNLQVCYIRLSSHEGLHTAADFIGGCLSADAVRGGGLELQQGL
jgi:hypothetical protein